MPMIAKVLKCRTGQVVQLPRGFRLDGDRVYVKRVGSVVLLIPMDKAWDIMAEAVGKVDKDFLHPRRQPRRAERRREL